MMTSGDRGAPPCRWISIRKYRIFFRPHATQSSLQRPSMTINPNRSVLGPGSASMPHLITKPTDPPPPGLFIASPSGPLRLSAENAAVPSPKARTATALSCCTGLISTPWRNFSVKTPGVPFPNRTHGVSAMNSPGANCAPSISSAKSTVRSTTSRASVFGFPEGTAPLP